ncbi:MAG: hypothetical protein QGD94_03755 [Planctomycetia bacterium]|nr:hypothetical protein [Planctomycetia bacterium]
MLATWTEFWQKPEGLLYGVLALQVITLIWLFFAHVRITRNQLTIAKMLKELSQE